MRLSKAHLIVTISLAPYPALSWTNPENLISTSEFSNTCDLHSKEHGLLSPDFVTSARETRILTPLRGIGAGLCLCPLLQLPAPGNAVVPGTDCPTSLDKYYPDAFPISQMPNKLRKVLPEYTQQNTLLCTSLCSDEINNPFLNTLGKVYGPAFVMGGLAGVPFVGTSGVGAAVSHVPEDGKMLVIYGSHVGYSSYNNKLGKVKREGRSKLSTACGAAIGALKAIQTGKYDPTDGFDENDPQESYLLSYISKRYFNEDGEEMAFEDEDDAVAWVTKQAFEASKETLKKIVAGALKGKSFTMDDVALLGGVLINRGTQGEDLFAPLSLEVDGKEICYCAFKK